jgi:hypothetical protein
MILSERLSRIASYVPGELVVADIGTDHALLPIYLVLQEIASHVIACDISSGPLESARANIYLYKLTEKIEIRQGDGLEPLNRGEADVIIISGMGGAKIRDILETSPDVLDGVVRIILQPQRGAGIVRRWLFDHDWEITDCITGKALYFDKGEMDKKFTILRASISLPFVSPIVHFRGYQLLDGGITDPIPIRQAITDGYQKNVVVLTRNQGYQKKPISTPQRLLLQKKYRDYPNLITAMLNRYQVYNKTLLYIDQLEQKGQVAVIRPSKKLTVDRFEKSGEKLNDLYKQGYDDAAAAYDRIKNIIKR